MCLTWSSDPVAERLGIWIHRFFAHNHHLDRIRFHLYCLRMRLDFQTPTFYAPIIVLPKAQSPFSVSSHISGLPKASIKVPASCTCTLLQGHLGSLSILVALKPRERYLRPDDDKRSPTLNALSYQENRTSLQAA